MKIGKIVKRARVRRGLKQQELATAMGVTTNYISLLENDHRDPSWRFVCELAETVQIPLPLMLLQGHPDFDHGDGPDSMTRVASELIGLVDDVFADED